MKINENKTENVDAKIFSPLLDSVMQKSQKQMKDNEEILKKIVDLQQKEINKLYERIYDLEKKLDECYKKDNVFEKSSEEISFENRKKYFTENISEKENEDLSKNQILVSISPKLNVENSELACSLNSINERYMNKKIWETNENSIEINGNFFGLKLQKKIENDKNKKFILFNIEGEIINMSNLKINQIKMKIKGNESKLNDDF